MTNRATTEVVVHGLRDLLGTSLVTALAVHGFDVTAAEPSTDRSGIVLVDLDVPGCAHVVDRAARSGWVVIGLAGDETRLAAAIAAGASGYFPKSGPLGELSDLLDDAAAGRQVMHPTERDRLWSVHRASESEREAWAERLKSLSSREYEVLQLLDQGLRAVDVAERLVLSIATVRTHIQRMLNKLEAGSQERAVTIYRAMVDR
ncbi:MAG TPA: LuxR C-terminal-related transcriptional regulator [Pseudonocardia sp.]